ncbi:hypothetical protein LSAT2_011804 [Lamellibrachia satsuma]|nr:hypothetical protein LSAT2_011804 [Lamellibrachia satsuma]
MSIPVGVAGGAIGSTDTCTWTPVVRRQRSTTCSARCGCSWLSHEPLVAGTRPVCGCRQRLSAPTDGSSLGVADYGAAVRCNQRWVILPLR